MRIIFLVPFNEFTGGIRGIRKYCEYFNKMGHDSRIFYPWRNNPRGIRNFEPNTYAYLSERQIPKADVIIAGSCEMAHVVNRLPNNRGKKYFYIQHYEQWDIHHGTAGIIQSNEDTYYFPLRHIIVSNFCRSLLPVKREDDVVVTWGRDPIEHIKNYSIPRILYQRRPIPWKGNPTLDLVLPRLKDVEIHSYGVPFLPDEEVDALFKWCNIFVFPSWIEGFGEPPLEAAGYGCSVVTTNTNAMPELFGNSMLYCNPKEPECLYNTIRMLVDRSDLREKYGKQARLIYNNHTFANQANKFLQVLLED